MRISKFLYFTIKDDNLDVIKLEELINLPAETFIKGQVVRLNKKHEAKQKTNRWIYSAIAQDEISVEKFLEKHLEILCEKLPILESYIKNYSTLLELVIYCDDPECFFISLNKKIIEMLFKMDISFEVVFY